MSSMDFRRIAQQQAVADAVAVERRLKIAAELFGGMLTAGDPVTHLDATELLPYLTDLARLSLVGADKLLELSQEDPGAWFEVATTEPWDGKAGECPDCDVDVADVVDCSTPNCPTMAARQGGA